MNNLGRGSVHLDLLCCEERREDRQTKEWPGTAPSGSSQAKAQLRATARR